MTGTGGALLGFTDQPLGPDRLWVLGLADPVRVGGAAALVAGTPLTDASDRLRRISLCCQTLSRVVPVARSAIEPGAIAGFIDRNLATILRDLDRLQQQVEIVFSLSLPLAERDADAAPDATGGGGRAWLRDRAAAHTGRAAVQAGALALAAGIVRDAAPDLIDDRLRSFPTVAPGGACAGVDLSILVHRCATTELSDRLLDSAKRLVPAACGASGGVTGPFPPFSFAALVPSDGGAA